MLLKTSKDRVAIRKFEFGLAFALSVAIGVFTTDMAKGQRSGKLPMAPQSSTVQAGFSVVNGELEEKAADFLDDETPAIQPIIGRLERSPLLLAERPLLEPTPIPIRRQPTHGSMNVLKSATPILSPSVPTTLRPSAPIVLEADPAPSKSGIVGVSTTKKNKSKENAQSPFLSDDGLDVKAKTSLIDLVPGEDDLSKQIIEATSNGIDAKDFQLSAEYDKLLETNDLLPLTIDDALRNSVKDAKRLLPSISVSPKLPDAVPLRRDLPQLPDFEPVTVLPPGLSSPMQVPGDREFAGGKAPPVSNKTIPRKPVVVKTEDAKTKPSPISPSVSSLRTDTKPVGRKETLRIDGSKIENPSSESVLSVESFIKQTDSPPQPELDIPQQEDFEVEIVEQFVEENPVSDEVVIDVQTESIAEKSNSVDKLSKLIESMPKSDTDASKPGDVSVPALEQQAESTPKLGQKPAPQKPVPPRYTIPREPNVRITRQMSALQPRIAKALRHYFEKPLNTKDDSAWSVMHSILGYGPNGMLAINGDRGRRTNALNWMCSNNPLMNRRLLYLDNGYIKGVEGPGFQGHPGQFLAMLAQINISREFPVQVQGQSLKVQDLINSEMYTCDAKRELTFKLISLSHYLRSEAQWKNETGEVWDVPRMLEIELAQPVNGAACGGTHRVMAISFAVRTKERRGEPLEGVYLRAQTYMRDYQRYTMSLQNRDGSFSSDWYQRRSDWGDKNRKLQTTGHLLEWLVYSLPRNELSDPRIVRAVDFLTNLMTRHRYHDWEVGPRGHAIRALALYHQRVFERQRVNVPVASTNNSTSSQFGNR